MERKIWEKNWLPTTDREVEAILKIDYLNFKEKERLLNNIRVEIQELEEKANELESDYVKKHDRILYLCGQFLEEGADEECIKETATTLKYKMTRGTIVVNKPQVKFVKPTESEKQFLMSKFPIFKTTKEDFAWGEFKKILEINHKGQVVNMITGEVIEDVTQITTPETLDIKYK